MATNQFFLALATTVALGGCATAPLPSKDATDVPSGRIDAFTVPTAPEVAKAIVIRDSGMFGGGCFYALWIDGTLAGRFSPGEKAEFYVSPGERLLRVDRDPQGKGLCALDGDNWTQRESIFRPKETKYFRLRIGIDGKTDVERTDP